MRSCKSSLRKHWLPFHEKVLLLTFGVVYEHVKSTEEASLNTCGSVLMSSLQVMLTHPPTPPSLLCIGSEKSTIKISRFMQNILLTGSGSMLTFRNIL